MARPGTARTTVDVAAAAAAVFPALALFLPPRVAICICAAAAFTRLSAFVSPWQLGRHKSSRVGRAAGRVESVSSHRTSDGGSATHHRGAARPTTHTRVAAARQRGGGKGQQQPTRQTTARQPPLLPSLARPALPALPTLLAVLARCRARRTPQKHTAFSIHITQPLTGRGPARVRACV